MKKTFYLLLMLMLITVSCNKTPDAPEVQDVIFQASTNSTGFKASACDNPIANFALIDIDGTTHQVDVFYLDNKIYTNSIKLSPGEHTIDMFVLVNDGGTPDDPTNDIIVNASPLDGYEFANFVSQPMPLNFNVDAFYKAEVPVELLCYEAADYEEFGFAWFSVEEIVVREFCFFGDICIDDYMTYAGSLYENQRNGLQHDMPAIFKIDVIRNGDTLITYDNAEWFGEGRPLCVNYPDYSNYTDEYKFVLSILLKDGDEFNYKKLYTWETVDDEPLPNIGDDNVMDFVMGDCAPDADLIIPPPENPNPDPDPVDYTIHFNGNICVDQNTYEPTEFKIVFTDNSGSTNYFNDPSLNGGELSIVYTDNYGVVDNFQFDLWVKVDGVFTEYKTLTITDDGGLFDNSTEIIFTDGVVDFILGDCDPDADIIIPYEYPTPNPSPISGEETAFAYGGSDYAICFLDDPDAPNNSRWGWTNGLYSTSSSTTYSMELWAGAADCDQTKGAYVGTVTFTYKSGKAKVKYNIIDGVNLDAVHLYVGNEKYPLNGITSTVAPGKFTFIDDDASDGIDTEITISGLSGQIYIIAHADVSGN